MALVFGLGNPGARYAGTRHNAGWRVLEVLVERWKARPVEATPEFRAWRAEAVGPGVDLVLPLTFMNVSGEALEAWAGRHPFERAELLVVVDDVYLPVGSLRLRAEGSDGGHRGLESIEVTLGSREFARLRIGVGATSAEGLREHVLAEPEGEERKALDQAIGLAADAVECWAREGILAAMNRFNRKVRKEVSES